MPQTTAAPAETEQGILRTGTELSPLTDGLEVEGYRPELVDTLQFAIPVELAIDPITGEAELVPITVDDDPDATGYEGDPVVQAMEDQYDLGYDPDLQLVLPEGLEDSEEPEPNDGGILSGMVDSAYALALRHPRLFIAGSALSSLMVSGASAPDLAQGRAGLPDGNMPVLEISATGQGSADEEASSSADSLRQRCIDAGLVPPDMLSAEIFGPRHHSDGSTTRSISYSFEIGEFLAECVGKYRRYSQLEIQLQNLNPKHPKQFVATNPWEPLYASSEAGSVQRTESLHRGNSPLSPYKCMKGPAKTRARMVVRNRILLDKPKKVPGSTVLKRPVIVQRIVLREPIKVFSPC